METPVVAVWMVTYNHANFVSQAVESVMAQKTNFKYKLYIGEDCSQDDTRNICIGLFKKYPDKLELFLNEENDLRKNSATIYNACFNSGAKYIAMCEGDDYWTDPYKLQKQVDFMENNSRFSTCFHQVQIISQSGINDHLYEVPEKDVLNTVDLLKKHYIPTCSLLFRNEYFLKENLNLITQSISGDIPLEVLLSTKGETKYLNQKMACYRRHLNGLSQTAVQIANMKAGYIKMYSTLLSKVSVPAWLYLQYLITRLRLSIVKSKLLKQYN